MKAMIFAAGLGTRMRPLTDNTPKALVKVAEKPLLEWVIRYLKRFGFDELVINTHYLSEQVLDFLEKNKNFGIEIHISDESNMILETGGGLKKAQHFFNDGKPFLCCNTDILSAIDLHLLQKKHTQNKSIATIAVSKRQSSRQLLFNQQNLLSGWLNNKSGEVKLARTKDKLLQMQAFSCFQIIEPRIFEYFPKEDFFGIIDFYLKVAEKERISAFPHDGDAWVDVGTPQNLAEAETVLKQMGM